MSKRDLIHNEDFKAYQKDLEERLTSHVRHLHKLVYEGTTGLDREADLLMRINTQRALIAEVEAILNLPMSSIYVGSAEESKALAAKQGGKYLGVFKTIFSTDPTASGRGE